MAIDDTQVIAAAAGAITLLLARGPTLQRPPRAWFVGVAALAAAALSWLYVAGYLRGGPRIIDATAYWLQARTFAEGALSLPLPEPEQAVVGRFLVRAATPGHAGVIFPPGYPAVLAGGFALGAPLALGPLLAAGLVVATDALARQIARADTRLASLEEPVARAAVLLSVTCGALRYHTADTMAHGLSALLLTVCAAAALASNAPLRRSSGVALAFIVGLAGGWLFATRTVSAVTAAALTVALVAWRRRSERRIDGWRALAALAGVLPGVALWLVYQHHLTGDWTSTAQAAYYAASDGPPGCFRYGFGAGIGCLGEHGSFVQATMPDGHGLREAIWVSGRRWKMHLSDALNATPLYALVVVGWWAHRRVRAASLLAAAVVLQTLLYAPFYFDGNYPGGGGRMLADVLPLEHVLAAFGVATFTRRAGRRGAPAWAAALALWGWSLEGAADHAQLRDRDGGEPFFLAQRLREAGVERGLVLIDSDHGFNLAYRPATGAELLFARGHGDALDRLVWEHHGRPQPVVRYRFESTGGRARVTVEPVSFPEEPAGAAHLRIEGESLWPPRRQRAGWAWPEHTARPCASGGRWLVIRPAGKGSARIELTVPSRALAGRQLAPRLAAPTDEQVVVRVWLQTDAGEQVRWEATTLERSQCTALAPRAAPAATSGLTLVVEASRAIALDALDIRPSALEKR